MEGRYLMETTAQSLCDAEPHQGDLYSEACPCREILDLIASRWSALIIGKLELEPHRFGQLRRAIPGITQKMLTQTLRRLESNGLVDRTVIPARPPQVEYALTDLGHSAAIPLGAVRSWSEENLGAVREAQRRFEEREAALAG